MQQDDQKIDGWIIDPSVLLGQGTFGNVMRCYRQNNPNQFYGVKIIPKFNIAVRDSDLEKSIQNEKNVFQIFAKEKVKPENLVEIIEVIEKQQKIYIIMELCDHDLQKEFDNIKPNWFSRLEQLDIIQQIIKGACDLKNNKLIHRDIKPQNILVKIVEDENKKQRKIYKIADFGFSRTLDNMYQKANLSLVGSMNYYAPEIFYQKQFSAKCDIYSYGLLFHQIAFQGKLPFKEDEGQSKHFETIKNSNFKCNELQGQYGDLITNLIERMVVFSEDNRIGFEELQKLQIANLKLEMKKESLFIPYFVRSTENEIQASEIMNQKQKSEKIYKILNIYYHKYLLCQHVRNHLKSKFQSLDQYLLILIILIGEIGFIQIKYAFSLIIQTYTDIEELLIQQTNLPFLLQIVKKYLEQSNETEKYSQINSIIQKTYHEFNFKLKNEFNELIKQFIQEKDKQINNDYQNILEKKIYVIKKLQIQNLECQILCDELVNLMNNQINPHNKIFDQIDLDLIKRVENLQKMFQISEFRFIDVNQIFDPNQY